MGTILNKLVNKIAPVVKRLYINIYKAQLIFAKLSM